MKKIVMFLASSIDELNGESYYGDTKMMSLADVSMYKECIASEKIRKRAKARYTV